MIARAYEPRDREQIEKLLQNSDVDPERDFLVVVELDGRIVQIMALRPCLFVHDFEVSATIMKRQVADCAHSYAMGAARAMGHREAIFVIKETNDRMRGWIKERGARQQDPGAVYTMEIR